MTYVQTHPGPRNGVQRTWSYITQKGNMKPRFQSPDGPEGQPTASQPAGLERTGNLSVPTVDLPPPSAPQPTSNQPPCTATSSNEHNEDDPTQIYIGIVSGVCRISPASPAGSGHRELEGNRSRSLNKGKWGEVLSILCFAFRIEFQAREARPLG